jgi:hypothetical protein
MWLKGRKVTEWLEPSTVRVSTWPVPYALRIFCGKVERREEKNKKLD